MSKINSYDMIKNYIEQNKCVLLLNEQEFEREKIKQDKCNTEIKLKILCGNCGKEIFYRTFHNFKLSKNNKCNTCKYNDLYSKERIDMVINMYNENYKMSEISKKVHMKPQMVSKILKNNNIEIKNNTDYRTSEELATAKKYNFNEDYFKIIDTQEKAYWLGMIYADGNVFIRKGSKSSKGAVFEITLQDEDLYHLYNFRNCINGNMPVKEKNVKRDDKIFENHRLTVSSIKFVNNLIDKGCVPNKSLILKFPEEDKLPPKFYDSFIRGYFDGDGCIGFYPNKRTKKNMTILGTYDFLLKIKDILMNIGITHIGLYLPKDRNAWVLGMGSIDNLTKFFNFIYNDKCYFLGRKYDKFVDLLNYYEKDYNISTLAKLSLLL